MRILPSVKVTDLDLRVIATTKALVTTIDIFRFIHEESAAYVTVEIECSEGHEFLDDIAVLDKNVTLKKLEGIALNWIFKHVELKNEGDYKDE